MSEEKCRNGERISDLDREKKITKLYQKLNGNRASTLEILNFMFVLYGATCYWHILRLISIVIEFFICSGFGCRWHYRSVVCIRRYICIFCKRKVRCRMAERMKGAKELRMVSGLWTLSDTCSALNQSLNCVENSHKKNDKHVCFVFK